MTDSPEPACVVALRTIGPTLIELPFTVPAGTTPWAASIWPDPGAAGWGRDVWTYDRTRRGWTIPPSCTHGTIIELGAAAPAGRRYPARTELAWYAVALAHDLHWLICTTPFPHPTEAHDHARHLIDRHRHGIIERYNSGDGRAHA